MHAYIVFTKAKLKTIFEHNHMLFETGFQGGVKRNYQSG